MRCSMPNSLYKMCSTALSKRKVHWFSFGRIVLVGAAVLLISDIPARAGLVWDLVGDYDFSYYVQLGLGSLSLDITSENFATGAFTAVSSDSGTTISNGQFDGSQLSFDAVFNGLDSFGFPLTCDFVFDGPIASDGTFSGFMERNCAGHGFFTGSFTTASGNAAEVGGSDFELLEYVGGSN